MTSASVRQGEGAPAPVLPVEPPPPARPPRARTTDLLERYALVLVFACCVVGFGVAAPDTFLTTVNVRNIVSNQSVLAIVALAAIVPLVGGQFDLSLGASVGVSAIVCGAVLGHADLGTIPAVVCAISASTLVGAVNAFIVTRLNVNSLIATLGMSSVLAGGLSWYTKGTTISDGIPDGWQSFGTGLLYGVPIAIYVVLTIALALGYVLTRTPFGRQLEAVGSNPRAATLVGINTPRVTAASFVLAGSLAGVAGVLQVARSASASPTAGPALLLAMVSAAFLGATTIRPGKYNILGTLVAVLFIGTTVSGLALSGVPYFVEPIFNGAALILAVALTSVFARRRGMR
jgi:ribose transport system permease protein